MSTRTVPSPADPTEPAEAAGPLDVDDPVEAAPEPASPGAPDGAAAAQTTPDEDRWATVAAKRFVLLVTAAMVVGFAVRVAIGLTDDAPSTDETAYLESGMSLIEGDGFQRNGEPELHFPPFIPLLFGLASKVVGDPHVGAVWLTIISGTLAIVPLALLGRRIAGSLAGVTTAWVAALVPGLATTTVNRGAGSEATYLLLVVGAAWLMVSAVDHRGRARLVRAAGSGLAVGLAYLTRPEGLFLAVPLGLALVWLAGRGVARRRWIGAVAPPALAFALPLVACIVPYSAYLHTETGKWLLTAKTQDISLEAWHAVAEGDREARDQELYALDPTTNRFPSQRSSLTSLAREDPSGYLGILGTNVNQLYRVLFETNATQFLAWLLLPAPVWILAVLGAWRHRRSRVVQLVGVVGLLPVITGLIFFVQVRYLVVTVALLSILVGVGLASMRTRWRAPVLGAVAALLLLSTVQGFEGRAGWWHPADHGDQRGVGEWIEANTDPDDVIMARSFVVEYYAERPTIAIPYADLPQILDFGRHYGAQYLVVDWYAATRLRPQLEPLQFVDQTDDLQLVYEHHSEARTSRVFALVPAPPPSAERGPPLGFVGDG